MTSSKVRIIRVAVRGVKPLNVQTLSTTRKFSLLQTTCSVSPSMIVSSGGEAVGDANAAIGYNSISSLLLSNHVIASYLPSWLLPLRVIFGGSLDWRLLSYIQLVDIIIGGP